MKCGNYVKWEERRKKGSGKPYLKAVKVYAPRPGVLTKEDLIAAGHVLCGGDISVEIRADEDPYMGGVSAVLEVELTCTKCGNTPNQAVYVTMFPGTKHEYRTPFTPTDMVRSKLNAAVTEWLAAQPEFPEDDKGASHSP